MTRFERITVNSSTAIVGFSGVVYGVMKYLMTSSDPFSVVNHPLQPWMLDLHVLGGPLMIFAVGLVTREHIFGQLRKRSNGRGRTSGMIALSCLLPMIATGYLIQVFTDETARFTCVVLHLSTGAVYLGVFFAHTVIGRRIAALKNGESRVGRPVNGWSRASSPRRRQARKAI